MTIEDQLKNEILSKYKSVRAFTTAIDIPYSTLDSVFKRGIGKAGVETMIKVFRSLDLDIESISTGTLNHRVEPKQIETTEHSVLIRNFYSLNKDGRSLLIELSDALVESERYQQQETESQRQARWLREQADAIEQGGGELSASPITDDTSKTGTDSKD